MVRIYTLFSCPFQEQKVLQLFKYEYQTLKPYVKKKLRNCLILLAQRVVDESTCCKWKTRRNKMISEKIIENGSISLQNVYN